MKVACILPDDLGDGPYQVGALRALGDSRVELELISGSGAGALNAMLLGTGGIELLEDGWTNRTLYWKIILLKYGDCVSFGILLCVLGMCHRAFMLTFVFVVVLAVWLIVWRMLRGFFIRWGFTLMTSDGGQEEVQSPLGNEVVVTLSEKSYLFDPTDVNHLSALPISARAAGGGLPLYSRMDFRGKATWVRMPKYQTVRLRRSRRLSISGWSWPTALALIASGSVDPVPIRPALQRGCGTVIIVGLIHRGWKRDRSPSEWLTEHVQQLERKFLLKTVDSRDLAERFNILLAASGTDALGRRSPEYKRLGENLLKELNLNVGTIVGASKIFFIGRKRASNWNRFPCKAGVSRLMAAGYRDMMEVINRLKNQCTETESTGILNLW